MRILIVEDEMLQAKQLKKMLQHAEPLAHIMAITNSVEETVSWLQTNNHPDLIMMDIELADGQSFEIFKRVKIHAPIIFTTAYNEYAIRAFKVNSIDYLLKPVNEEELKAAIHKFNTVISITSNYEIEKILTELKKHQQPKEYRSRFLVKQGTKMISIEIADISYIFSSNGFSFIRTIQNQKHILEYTLDELEDFLSPQLFFRANRKFILSSRSIIGIHPWFNQKLKVEVKPEAEEHVVISRDKANAFKLWLGE